MRPLFIFDRDCAFCVRVVARWKTTTEDHVDFAAYQDVASQFPDIHVDQFRAAAHLIDAEGAVHVGAAAIFRLLAHGGSRALLTLYARFDGFALAADRAYAFVARHRTLASHVTRAFLGRDLRRPTFFLTRWLFLRLIGVVALAAFVSFARQARGLLGEHGIAPIAAFLDRVRAVAAASGWSAFELHRIAPTLFWIAPTDRMITVVTFAGIAASIALIVDVAPALAIAVIWITYLSIATAGSTFMSYQWDTLLLESCVVAIFLAPLRIRPRLFRDKPPSAVGLWLGRLLIFKLMFMSGIVKHLSGDPTWKNLTALDYHYWTQPLPTWTSWYVSQLSPPSIGNLCTWLVLAIETYVPFLIFAPRRARYVAFLLFALLQCAIAATGNYGFFNLLTFAIAILLVDDAPLAKPLARTRLAARFEAVRARSPRSIDPSRRKKYARVFAIASASLIGILSLFHVLRASSQSFEAPAPLAALEEWIAPFGSINSYGLFAVMTTERPEILVEGSADGVTWIPYRFRWKPNADVTERPRFDPLDMPRLDWQMWFAALEARCERVPWYQAFAHRLLEGSPDVLSLLANNPFPNAPPRYLRSRMFRATFTNREEHAATGAWWKREEVTSFCPPLQVSSDGKLMVAERRDRYAALRLSPRGGRSRVVQNESGASMRHRRNGPRVRVSPRGARIARCGRTPATKETTMATQARPLAIVTGASTGIGLELAKCCAEKGFDLVIAADEVEIQNAATALRAIGVRVEAVQADLATIEGVDKLYAAVQGRSVDALLANAGRGLGHGFLDQAFEEARRVVDTNITGTIYLIQKVGRDMRARGKGRILITGSIAGFMPGSYQAVYNGTKAFLDSFSFALRHELKESGVTVTCLMPGATETEFFARADMLDTKVGAGKKDPADEVAKVGFEAMMRGDGDVVSGWKNKLQAAIAHVMPSDALAEQHVKMAKPGTAQKS